jgi:hypothetical protein
MRFFVGKLFMAVGCSGKGLAGRTICRCACGSILGTCREVDHCMAGDLLLPHAGQMPRPRHQAQAWTMGFVLQGFGSVCSCGLCNTWRVRSCWRSRHAHANHHCYTSGSGIQPNLKQRRLCSYVRRCAWLGCHAKKPRSCAIPSKVNQNNIPC